MRVTSPFIKKYDTYVQVEAGRKSTGYNNVFIGVLLACILIKQAQKQ